MDHLATDWRDRADSLDIYARKLRNSGDSVMAEDAEHAAMDYRIAADEREAQFDVDRLNFVSGHNAD